MDELGCCDSRTRNSDEHEQVPKGPPLEAPPLHASGWGIAEVDGEQDEGEEELVRHRHEVELDELWSAHSDGHLDERLAEDDQGECRHPLDEVFLHLSGERLKASPGEQVRDGGDHESDDAQDYSG